MFGVIEGFYGAPWSWEFRCELAQILSKAGMDTYVYAPKDDPLHRQQWREPYPKSVLKKFQEFVDHNTLRLGFALSPGLSMDYNSQEDRLLLRDKFLALIDSGAQIIGLLVDDIEPTANAGVAHGTLVAWLREVIPTQIEMFFVPLHYTGVDPAQYLNDINKIVPQIVPIAWTGRFVVNTTITVEDAQKWSEIMGGRKPVLWDNTPVNDAIMERHLFTGPLTGREQHLPEYLSGYLANPMVQGNPSIAPLLSAAAWLQGKDPQDAWHDALVSNPAQLRFMEALSIPVATQYCNDAIGENGQALSRDGLKRLQQWLLEVKNASDGGFGEEVTPWVQALQIEVDTALLATELLLANNEEFQRDLVTVVATSLQPPLEKYALGAPKHLQPRMFHDHNSHWRLDAAAFEPSSRLSERLLDAVKQRAAMSQR